MADVLGSFSGAGVRRVIDRSHGIVPEHAHDWPVLSIFVLGGYRNRTELGEVEIAAPSVVLYRARAAHENRIGASGFEQLEIEFDPAWLGGRALPQHPVRRATGGEASSAARALMQGTFGGEAGLRLLARRLVDLVQYAPERRAPPWLAGVERRLRAEPGLGARDLARVAGRHPAWLGVAYARATGEGLAATSARLRVERAARLLRETDEGPAAVAAEAGFCDQSHMIRSFRRLLGRTPSEVRSDRDRFRSGPPPA